MKVAYHRRSTVAQASRTHDANSWSSPHARWSRRTRCSVFQSLLYLAFERVIFPQVLQQQKFGCFLRYGRGPCTAAHSFHFSPKPSDRETFCPSLASRPLLPSVRLESIRSLLFFLFSRLVEQPGQAELTSCFHAIALKEHNLLDPTL